MPLSPDRALARELADLRRRLISVERGGQLSRSSVTVDGSAVPVTDGIAAGVRAEVAAAEALDAAADADAKADGAVVAYYGDTADVSAAQVGDFWRKSNGDVFTFDGAEWQPVTSPDVRAAMDAAAQAQSTADGKVTTFYEVDAEPPTAEGVGDIWYVTDLDNLPRRWDGVAWVDVRDRTIETAQQTADDALFDANNITGAQILNGEISSEKIAQAYTDTLNLSAQEKADLAAAQALADAKADATSKADTAEANAISTAAADATAKANAAEADAKTYTDTEKAAWLDSAALTAQEKADLAEAQAISAAATDATTKADAAEADAIAAAQTKADAARDAAIATAADDATTKANAAEADAISAAALDATSKADAAEAAAVDAAALDATSKADAAENNAKAYTDAEKAAWLDSAALTAQEKADLAEADAIAETEAVEDRILSRGTDLVTNGTGYLGNNFNFSAFTFDPTDAPIGAAGSFTIEGNTYGIWADELIPVSGSKKYRYSFAVRQQVEGVQSRFYGAIQPMDAAGNGISPPHYMYEAGTTTTLAQPLNVGDTEVYLSGGGANFYGSPDKPAGASDHKRRIVWWDYTDPFGKTWAPETYSRHTTGSDTWADGAVVGNVITLRAPYDGPAKPAGTYLSNGSAGGSYIYTAPNQIAPQEWTSYGESIDGAMEQGEPNSGRGVARMVTGLPPGTASIRVGWLVNRDDPGGRQAFANVSFSDASAAQSTADAAADLAVSEAAAAKQDAIDAAAADATSKADAAEAAAVATAEGYTDSRTSNITSTQIADDAITTPKIATNAIVAGSISAGAVGAVALAANSVEADKIAAGAVVAGKIASSAIVAGNIKAGEINAGHLAVDSVTADAIATGAVTADSVSANAIGAVAISASAIDSTHLTAGAVIAGKIAADAVTATEIKAGEINTGHLAADAITASKISAGAIGTSALAADAVVADKIAAGAIAAGHIAAGAVTAAKIDADAINGKTITGATVQTDAAAATGIKLTSSALNMWDTAGNRTFHASPSGGLSMVGDLSTRADNAAGIVLRSGPSNTTVDGLGPLGDSVVELWTDFASAGPGEILADTAYDAMYPSIRMVGAPFDASDTSVAGRPQVILAYDENGRSRATLSGDRVTLSGEGFGVESMGKFYAGGGLHVSGEGITAPLMRPVHVNAGSFTRVSPGQTVNMTDTEVSFVVPASGSVTVNMGAQVRAYPSSGQVDIDFIVNDSSGTVYVDMNPDAIIHSRLQDWHKMAGFRLLTGLPVGTTVTLWPRLHARTEGDGDAGCTQVETVVTPAM